MTKKAAWRFGVPVLAVALGLLVGRLYDWGPAEVDAPTPPVTARADERPASPRPQPAPVVVPATAVVTEVPARPVQGHDVVATEYHPRPPDEWQGMRVNLALQATCDETAECGLAMSCRNGRCGPCEADKDCAGGEICVLDHCVRRELADCRWRADCNDGELCVLSGYSHDARNNADLRATCLSGAGGAEEGPAR